jgi:hypothetical protein
MALPRDRLQLEIMVELGITKMAVGEPKDYQALGRTLNSTIRAEERALLKRTQGEYDATTPVLEIQRQLDGEVSDDEDAISESESVSIKLDRPGCRADGERASSRGCLGVPRRARRRPRSLVHANQEQEQAPNEGAEVEQNRKAEDENTKPALPVKHEKTSRAGRDGRLRT